MEAGELEGRARIWASRCPCAPWEVWELTQGNAYSNFEITVLNNVAFKN